MPTTLTQQQIDTLEEVTDSQGLDIRAYSGRCMYGEDCLGIVCDSEDIMEFTVSLYKCDPELATLLSETPCRSDSMGRSGIIYWESIKVDGTSLANYDDEVDQ